ncbi:MAG: histidine phosphatase family protein [Candidatus Sumerlaeota bacterium]
MILLLMRHGIAEDIDAKSDAEDAARALTGKGRRETERIAKTLKNLGIKPNIFLSSSRVRAKQTAKIAAKSFGAKQVTETDALDFTSTFEILANELNERAGKKKNPVIIAASHEPFCGEFLRHAIQEQGAQIHFAKSGVAMIEWKGEVKEEAGELLMYLTPKKI